MESFNAGPFVYAPARLAGPARQIWSVAWSVKSGLACPDGAAPEGAVQRHGAGHEELVAVRGPRRVQRREHGRATRRLRVDLLAVFSGVQVEV